MSGRNWPGTLLRAYGEQPWLLEEGRALQMMAALELRAKGGAVDIPPAEARDDRTVLKGRSNGEQGKGVGVIRLRGTVAPRLSGVNAMSGSFIGLEELQRSFSAMAARDDLKAIVMDIDSPGGQVDLVMETAQIIRGARRDGRPIVAVANTMAASAAYWLAAAADEIVVTPSGQVGSIGVLTVHQDVSERAKAEGVRVTVIRAGERKAENHPFAPLGEEARGHLQAHVSSIYEAFVSDVAAWRGVSANVVRADPEKTASHFGGGRTALAADAVRLGMADSVATIDQTIARLLGGGGRRSARSRARRMALA